MRGAIEHLPYRFLNRDNASRLLAIASGYRSPITARAETSTPGRASENIEGG